MSRRLAGWFALVAIIVLIAYLGRITEGKPPEDTLYRYETAVGVALVNALIFGFTLLISRGTSKRDLFALRRPRSWPRALGLAFLVFAVVNVVLLALEPTLNAGDEQGLTPPEWEPSRAGAYLTNALMIATVVPVVEELLYRGAGFSLLRPWGAAVAIVVVGAAFALAHGVVAGLPIFVLLGIGLAILRERTDSVYPCILLHAVFNGLALAAVPLEVAED